MFMGKIFFPNKFNIIATLLSLSISYSFGSLWSCTGNYPLDEFGNPALENLQNWEQPFSVMCFGNYLSDNHWIYFIVAMITYLFASLVFRKKIKN
jgi:hypothetical protein